MNHQPAPRFTVPARLARFGVLSGVLAAALFTCLLGCGGAASTQNTTAAASISVSVDSTAITTTPGGSPVVVHTTSGRANTQDAITLSVAPLPAGLTVAIVQPGTGVSGTLSFSESATAAAGAYPLTVTAAAGAVSASTVITATVSAADAITVTAPATAAIASQDGTTGSAMFTVSRSVGNGNAITASVTGLPTGLTASVTQPGSGTTGTITFSAANTPAAAGTYIVSLTATDGTATATASVSVIVAVAEHVYNTTDTTLGVNGHLQEAMSTNFQPFLYTDAFLPTFPAAVKQVAALNPQHIRIQPVSNDIPMQANSSPQKSSDWSFATLDQTVQPLLATGDDSPEFQIASAPSFLNNANGTFVVNSANLSLFASYAANLVRYYNTGGFTWGSQHFQSASSQHITWWAIFNEPNLNGITAAQYVQIYNALVPAMLAVDPTLKFSALELSGYTGQIQQYLPTLVGTANAGGLNAQVNNLTTHFYATCTQSDTDAALFAEVTGFAADITYMHNELAMRSDLSGLPVQVTENNVNSDYQLTTGYSACHPTQIYVADVRGTSPFFAAWRPLLFSQLGKAGNTALYHFLFEGSNQYGEVNGSSDAPYLSYWVDYWLQRTFPYDPTTTGASILRSASTESAGTVEVLATRNLDNSVSVLVTNKAVAAATDDNGAGTPRTVLLNLTDLGTFSSGTMTVLNASTPLSTGPASTSFTPASTVTVTLGGYGTTFLSLKP